MMTLASFADQPLFSQSSGNHVHVAYRIILPRIHPFGSTRRYTGHHGELFVSASQTCQLLTWVLHEQVPPDGCSHLLPSPDRFEVSPPS